MVAEKDTDTQDDLDTRAEETAEALEKQFGGFMEIRTTEEVVASNVNYPREGTGEKVTDCLNSKKILLRVSEFA